MKKVMGLFLIACVTLFGCSQAGDKQETIKVGMVTDVAVIATVGISSQLILILNITLFTLK